MERRWRGGGEEVERRWGGGGEEVGRRWRGGGTSGAPEVGRRRWVGGGKHREEAAVLGAVRALDAAAVDEEDLLAAGGKQVE